MTSCARRRPISLRISVTDRCQLRCLYCMPSGGVPRLTRDDVLSFEEIIRFARVLKRCFGLTKVHITGGEPLVRSGIVELVAMLAREGMGEIALTTNGQRLAAMVSGLKRAGLRRVNISLDSLQAETYRRLTRGGDLGGALAGLKAALHCGLAPVKLNVTVLRDVNSDELVDFARFGLRNGCEVRFLELMPIGPAAARFDQWFVSSADVLDSLGAAFDLRPMPVRPGSSSRNYVATDGQRGEGVIGLISSSTAPFCDDCRRLRLTATGRLLGCLAQPEGTDIRPLLRGGHAPDVPRLVEAVGEALRLKRKDRRFATTSAMVSIGG